MSEALYHVTWNVWTVFLMAICWCGLMKHEFSWTNLFCIALIYTFWALIVWVVINNLAIFTRCLHFTLVAAIGSRPKSEFCFLPRWLRWVLLPNERYDDSVSGCGSNTQPFSWAADTLALIYHQHCWSRSISTSHTWCTYNWDVH